MDRFRIICRIMFGMICSDVFQSFPICHLMLGIRWGSREEEIILLEHNDIRHTTHSCQLPSRPSAAQGFTITTTTTSPPLALFFSKVILVMIAGVGVGVMLWRGVVTTSVLSSSYYLSVCQPSLPTSWQPTDTRHSYWIRSDHWYTETDWGSINHNYLK